VKDPLSTSASTSAPGATASAAQTAPKSAANSFSAHKLSMLMLGAAMALLSVMAWQKLSAVSNGADEASVDASACFAVVNAGVLLSNVSEVPPTPTLAGALKNVSKTAPIGVSVVRRSPTEIGVVLPDDAAKGNPELAQDYQSFTLAQLGHPSCPHSDEARAILSKMIKATYP
jgi:hypothetical protein